jgi:glycosyltransferase involved in cell wall biosynthesis
MLPPISNVAPENTLTIGWRVAKADAGIASVRYRALMPILGLAERGYQSRIFDEADPYHLRGIDRLIFVKSLQEGDILLAQEAHRRGISVIYDLCDDIFIEGYQTKGGFASAASVFALIASHAQAVVVTTQPLADVVRKRVPEMPVFVIPDGNETPELQAAEFNALATLRVRVPWRFRRRRFRGLRPMLRRWMRMAWRAARRPVALVRRATVRVIKRLRRLLSWILKYLRRGVKRVRKWLHRKYWLKLAYRCYDAGRALLCNVPRRSPPRERAALTMATAQARAEKRQVIVWYGNHGAPYANFGMRDLLLIREALETVAKEYPVELWVISNSQDKYHQSIAGMAIHSRYIPWRPGVVEQALASAAVVVIPNSKDPFSICKSANRTVLALNHGCPVVATMTPALAPLAGSFVADDFLAGLRRYLGDKEAARADVMRGQQAIAQHFSIPVIAQAWDRVLQTVAAPAPRVAPELVVALQLVQDLDLAMPVIVAAQRAHVAVAAWCSMTLIKQSPRVTAQLQQAQVPMTVWADHAFGQRHRHFSERLRAVLAITESNLRPHYFCHALVKKANQQGIFTATMQHGLENIGLTYSDAVQPIGRVTFAAQRLYLWAGLDTLHPQVSEATRAKCVPMGCTKPAQVLPAELAGLWPAGVPTVIGVFENLHWHRFDDAYRAAFLTNLEAMAEKFPHCLFVVKPHHAGMYLTKRHAGDLPSHTNLLIADPANPAWERYTAQALMQHMQGVITTPSTVALDAARMGVPVAVAADEDAIARFAPLPLLQHAADWADFIGGLAAGQAGAHADALRAFAGRYVLDGDAASRMVADLFPSTRQQAEAA